MKVLLGILSILIVSACGTEINVDDKRTENDIADNRGHTSSENDLSDESFNAYGYGFDKLDLKNGKINGKEVTNATYVELDCAGERYVWSSNTPSKPGKAKLSRSSDGGASEYDDCDGYMSTESGNYRAYDVDINSSGTLSSFWWR